MNPIKIGDFLFMLELEKDLAGLKEEHIRATYLGDWAEEIPEGSIRVGVLSPHGQALVCLLRREEARHCKILAEFLLAPTTARPYFEMQMSEVTMKYEFLRMLIDRELYLYTLTGSVIPGLRNEGYIGRNFDIYVEGT